MTPLSPPAQAVLDAATAPTGDFCLENVNEIAAAALRAAARLNPGPFVPELFGEGWDAAMEALAAIAAELEATTP
jgi:hypothetical protein